MAEPEIELISHVEDIKKYTAEAIERALESVGITAEAYAKLLCPVDTGLLRNSITHAISGKSAAISEYKSNDAHADTPVTRKNGTAGKPAPVVTGSYEGTTPAGEKAVYIGTNVEYAQAVETGDSKHTPQPFLKPAATDHREEYRRIIENEFK